jgi:peptide/nickel transport system permease protein
MKERSIVNSILSDKLALVGLVILLFAMIVSIGGAYLRPDSSVNSNEQNLAIARQGPGFSATFLKVPKKVDENPLGTGLMFGGLVNEYSLELFDSLVIAADEVHLFWENEKVNEIGLVILYGEGRIVDDEAVAIHQFIENEKVLQKKFLLGTDSLGRDMLSRLMAGTIISLSVGLISVLISLLIGVLLGALAGYYRGWIDSLIMWFINVIWSIPTLLMVIAITLVMGKGFVQVFVAVGLTMWVEVARIVRGQFISLRTLPYIEAGRSMGFSSARLIFKHMLPNAMGPVIVISAANFASAILIEAGLSFLGIGTQIPMPSWGTMIKEHYAYITTDMAYLAVLPGVCITVLVLALMLVGNGLRDALDVRAAST